MKAQLLVPDEPTAEFDAASAALVVDALRAEADSGVTVGLSTNDPSLAAMCARVYTLHDGAIQADWSGVDSG
jgi:ABC-type multidrug transport system ATPase subunit